MQGLFFNFIGFIADKLPLIVWGILALVVVITVIRDRYSRRVKLTIPAEVAKLQQLQQNGKLAPEAAELLLRNCHAMPGVTEVAPVPDLGLRISVAICRVYCVMVMVYMVSFGATIYLMRQYNKFYGEIETLAISGNLWFLLIINLVIVVSLVTLFVASGYILKGSLRARNLSLALLMLNCMLLVKNAGAVYWVPGAAAIIFYLLLLRKQANRKISTQAAEYSKRSKIIWSSAGAICLAIGLMFTQIETKTATEEITGDCHLSYGGGNKTFFQLKKFVLLLGDEHPNTLAVAKLLAKKLPIECKIIPFGKGIVIEDDINVMPLMLARGLVPVKPQKNITDILPPEMPMEFRRQVEEAIARDLGVQELETKAMPVKYLLRTMQGNNLTKINMDGMIFDPRAVHFSAECAVSSDSKAGQRHAASLLSEKLIGILPDLVGKPNLPNLKIPPEILAKADPLPPARKIPELKNLRRLAVMRQIGGPQMELYSFIQGDKAQDFAAITKFIGTDGSLKNATLIEENLGDYILQSHTPDKHLIDVIWRQEKPQNPDENVIDFRPQPAVYQNGYVFIQHRSQNYKMAGLQNFLRTEEPIWFVLGHGLNNVQDDIQVRRLLENFFAADCVGNDERMIALQQITSRKNLSDIFKVEYKKLLESVKNNWNNVETLKKLNSLWSNGESAGCLDIFKDVFGDWITELEVGKDIVVAGGEDGQCELRWDCTGDADFVKCVIIKFPENKYPEIMINLYKITDPKNSDVLTFAFANISQNMAKKELCQNVISTNGHIVKWGTPRMHFSSHSIIPKQFAFGEENWRGNDCMKGMAHYDSDKKQMVLIIKVKGAAGENISAKTK